jgi:hypothetical protein
VKRVTPVELKHTCGLHRTSATILFQISDIKIELQRPIQLASFSMAGGKAEVERDSTAQAILAAAERFCNEKNGVSLPQKRLLYEFLAYPGPNGKTLSGLFAEGAAVNPKATADIVYMSRRWFGLHIIKHYYVMRQYKDASGIVLGFLKFMKAEGTLPSSMSKDLDTAIQVCSRSSSSGSGSN